MRRRSMRIEPLESRCMLSVTVFEHDNIGYFLDTDSPQIERYDIDNETWLSPVNLTGGTGSPTVAHADDDGIYVAYDKSVYRYNLDGSGQTHLLNAQSTVKALHTDGDVLFVNHTSSLYAKFVSINKTTNTVIDTFEKYVDSVYGSSIAKDANRIFGRTRGISPSDITYVSYSDAGQFLSGGESPYHGGYSGASTTWVFPNDTKVVDNSGNIYATANLTWLNKFSSSITDIDFVGDNVPIVLKGNTLTAYTPGILPAGTITLDCTPSNIFINDTNVIIFTADASLSAGYRTEIVPLSTLNTPIPNKPVNPAGLPYTPDKIEQAVDGTILLYSKSHQSIFCWDPIIQDYTDTIPLDNIPKYMAYSSEANTIYLAYDSGSIHQIDLDAEERSESLFVTLSSTPSGLSIAGQYIFACDSSDSQRIHHTFSPDGTSVGSIGCRYYSPEFTWSEANQKMYFIRTSVSPKDLLYESIDDNGAIGSSKDSPLHSSSGFTFPIRVSPDGSIVVLGSGMIHDGTTLERLTLSLANSITDATWLGGELFTTRTIAGVTQFQHWGQPAYEIVDVAQVSGTAHSLLTVADDRLLGITIDSSGIPVFTIMDENLDPIEPGEAAIAVDNTYRVSEDAFLLGNIITDDTGEGVDEPSDEISVVAINGNPVTPGMSTILESGATLTIQENGAIFYDPRTSSELASMISGETYTETIEYTVAHNTSGRQDSATVTITVEGIGENSGQSVLMVDGKLIVNGTPESDHIEFFGNDTSSDVWVRINNTEFGPFASPSQLLAFGGEGDDVIVVGSNLTHPLTELFGEAGNDRLQGGPAADILQGGAGNDILFGNEGDDYLNGGDGNDRILGNAHADTLLGGTGNDTLFGSEGDDYLDGEDGNDKLFGGLGEDLLFGGTGNDMLFGEEGEDYLDGGSGNDRLLSESTRTFTPPKNMSLGTATVPQRQAVAVTAQPLINPATIGNNATTEEKTLTTNEFTAIAKDISIATSKQSKNTKDEVFSLNINLYDNGN